MGKVARWLERGRQRSVHTYTCGVCVEATPRGGGRGASLHRTSYGCPNKGLVRKSNLNDGRVFNSPQPDAAAPCWLNKGVMLGQRARPRSTWSTGRSREYKIKNLQGEVDRIMAKERQEGGLTQGQAATLARNEQVRESCVCACMHGCAHAAQGIQGGRTARISHMPFLTAHI